MVGVLTRLVGAVEWLVTAIVRPLVLGVARATRRGRYAAWRRA